MREAGRSEHGGHTDTGKIHWRIGGNLRKRCNNSQCHSQRHRGGAHADSHQSRNNISYKDNGKVGILQGIADLVLVFDEHAEILDYKTDRSRDAQYYIDEYAAQLRLYRRAFAQRLAVPVTKLTIYSFAIEDEIDVPLA